MESGSQNIVSVSLLLPLNFACLGRYFFGGGGGVYPELSAALELQRKVMGDGTYMAFPYSYCRGPSEGSLYDTK